MIGNLPFAKSGQSSRLRDRYLLWVAIGLICLFVFFTGFRIVTQGDNVPHEGKLNLVLEKPLGVLSIDFEGADADFVAIPEETLLELPHGLGMYKAGSIPALSRQERRSMSILRYGMSKSLGITTDGWIGGSGSSVTRLSLGAQGIEKLSGIKSLPSLLSRDSNLSLLQRVKIFFEMGKIEDFRVRFVGLGDLDGMEEAKDPDEFAAIRPDTSRLSSTLAVALRDSKIAGEGLTVSVVNSSGVPNLARDVGRAVRNSGVRVVAETSRESYDGFCKVTGHNEFEKSFTAMKLKSWFGCSFEASEVYGRSQLEIWFGRKYRDFVAGE